MSIEKGSDMSSPFFFEQTMRHYHEELKRNERRAQHLAELALAERHPASRFSRSRGLVAGIPHLHRARSTRESYS
jgi:hypothetical protein